ncbi:GNAT family N-acetyltransferase [Aquimarina muelleri]|uniref:N-acetyltransferase n=1 Tax=Aquimarina muelleri TaxID=279356 RepID=A0A918N3R4_9FLAO|nr:GNAT family N-acetyltransferase [Aquimarina muelleri]MCX2763976.1 GNAT family N-acetyltransferase [Aquimarina muelleri]GGX22121.1 N-acetyltransferase [Aquimarina muelleri]
MTIDISTNTQKLDMDFIHHFLTRSYWAKKRTKQKVSTTTRNPLCFGVYLDNKQIGFARVLTDYTVFGYLMDLFIIEEQQGNGYSKLLMKAIMEHPDLQNISRWMLATSGAHKLYTQFGFTALPDPTKIMAKLITKSIT